MISTINPKILRLALTSTGAVFILTFLTLVLVYATDTLSFESESAASILYAHCADHKAYIIYFSIPKDDRIDCGWSTETVVLGTVSALTSLTFLVLFQCSRKISRKIPAIGVLGGLLLIASAVSVFKDIVPGAPNWYEYSKTSRAPFIPATVFVIISIIDVILGTLLAFKKSKEEQEEIPIGYLKISIPTVTPKIRQLALTSTCAAFILTFLTFVLAYGTDTLSYESESAASILYAHCTDHKAWILYPPKAYPQNGTIYCAWSTETVVLGIIAALTSLTFLVLFQCSRKISMKIPAVGLLGGLLLIASAVPVFRDISSGLPADLLGYYQDRKTSQSPFIASAVIAIISIINVILGALLAFKKSKEGQEETPIGYFRITIPTITPQGRKIALTCTGATFILTFLTFVLAYGTDTLSYESESAASILYAHCTDHKAWILYPPKAYPQNGTIYCAWSTETVVLGIIAALASLTFLVLFQCSRKISMKIPAVGLLGGLLLIASAVSVFRDISSGLPADLLGYYQDRKTSQTPFIVAAVFVIISIIDVILTTLWVFRKQVEPVDPEASLEPLETSQEQEIPEGYIRIE